MTQGDSAFDPRPAESSKQALLMKIDGGFQALLRSSESLSDPTAIASSMEDEWSVKDHLAHIAAWEEILLRFHIGGEPFETVVGVPAARYRVTSYDTINEHLHDRDKSMTPAEVMARLKTGHAAVMSALGGMTDEDLARPRAWLDAPDGPSGPMAQYIAWNTYEHYEEHLATIDALSGKTHSRP